MLILSALQLSALSKKASTLQQQLDRYKSVVGKTKQKITETNASVKQAKANNERLQSELQAATKRGQELQQRCATLEQDLTAARAVLAAPLASSSDQQLQQLAEKPDVSVKALSAGAVSLLGQLQAAVSEAKNSNTEGAGLAAQMQELRQVREQQEKTIAKMKQLLVPANKAVHDNKVRQCQPGPRCEASSQPRMVPPLCCMQTWADSAVSFRSFGTIWRR